jgi:FixJ family two-component response regulator
LNVKSRSSGNVDNESIVYIVDDDSAMCDSLSFLLGSVGLKAVTFPSAAEFLGAKLVEGPSCLVLDIRLPGVSGLDLQTQLANSGIRIPIVFMTGHADVPMSVRALKAGAIDFLTKPFRSQEMIDAVNAALATDRTRRETDQRTFELANLYESLTTREKEVMAHVTKGLMNKQIAGEMGLAEITVKVHRGHLKRKMGVRSVADLVRAAERLGLPNALQ